MSPLRKLVCAFVNSHDVFLRCSEANPAQDDVMTVRAAECLVRELESLKEAVAADIQTYLDGLVKEVI